MEEKVKFVITHVCSIFMMKLDTAFQNVIKISHYKFNLKENNVQKIAQMLLIVIISINKIKHAYHNVMQIKTMSGCKKLNA